MRVPSAILSSIALFGVAVTASAVPPRQILDLCAFVDTDLVLNVEGITKDFGKIDLCLCLSALPLFITTDVVAIAAVDALGLLGELDVLAALTNLVHAATPCTPSSSSHFKRELVLSEQVCPRGRTLCGVQSAWNSHTAWECLDTRTDLESCGGCSVGILGEAATGIDCTSLEGVDSVTCDAGECKVLAYRRGFLPSE